MAKKIVFNIDDSLTPFAMIPGDETAITTNKIALEVKVIYNHPLGPEG